MAVKRFQTRNRRCSLVKAFYFAILILSEAAEPATDCARFQFPKLSPNLSFTAKENSIVKLPFQLNTERCLGNANNSHFVYVLGPSSSQDYCVVRLSENSCSGVVNEKKCPCAETGGAAVFTKTLTKTDSGLWTWRTGDGVSKNVQVAFNVQTSKSTKIDTHRDLTVSANPGDISVALPDNGVITSPSLNNSDDVTTDSLTKTIAERADQDNEGGKEKSETDKNDGQNDKEEGSRKRSKQSDISDDKDDEKDDDAAAAADDDDNDTSVPDSVITGVVFVVANIVTIIVVAFIIIMIRRRRKRKRERAAITSERRRPNATLPRRPHSNAAYDVTTPRRNDVTTLNRSSHNYQALPGRESSGIYEEISAGKDRASDGYLVPVPKAVRSSNAYDDVA